MAHDEHDGLFGLEGRRLLLVEDNNACAEAVRHWLEICGARTTLRRTVRIAAVVGLVLTAINEGDSLAGGHVSAATGIKMALNFVVPFIVSNLGVLAATRGG